MCEADVDVSQLNDRQRRALLATIPLVDKITDDVVRGYLKSAVYFGGWPLEAAT